MPYAKEGFLKQVSITDCDGEWSVQNEIAEKQYFGGIEMKTVQIQWAVPTISRVGKRILKVSIMSFLSSSFSCETNLKQKSICIF